jgi:16S rRNA (guanine(966)-N(2))-methyltransferase RsmD
MRVIAGSLKGRRLKAPDWEGLRPTSDKARETLFNILAPRIAGARILDVYAGTGAVGIEALSRGARSVTFIERDRRAQDLIGANLAHCGVAIGYTLIRSDVRRALQALASGEAADIVLLDPPYDVSESEVADVLAAAGELLAAGGIAVLEHARRRRVPATAGRLVRSREVVSGSSTLTFYVLPSTS